MADSNSEPPRCVCGFFGRPETGGMCSKCYRDQQQKKGVEAAPEKANVSPDAFTKAVAHATASNVASSSSLPASAEPALGAAVNTPVDEATPSSSKDEIDPAGDESSLNGNKRSRLDSQSEQTTSGENKKKRDETPPDDPDKPPQKNKKRCFKCNCKLQPAIREIGRCKCEYIFCQLHRLPEQHDCIYDHKEKGRQEAREKMVSPKKHMGTSLKRIDSDS